MRLSMSSRNLELHDLRSILRNVKLGDLAEFGELVVGAELEAVDFGDVSFDCSNSLDWALEGHANGGRELLVVEFDLVGEEHLLLVHTGQ